LFVRSELVRLPYPASVPSDEAGLGVNGFGSFSRNVGSRPSGRSKQIDLGGRAETRHLS